MTILETDLTIFSYHRNDIPTKLPEIRKIFFTETVSEQIDIFLGYPEILTPEENGELKTIKALISSYAEQNPNFANIDLFRGQVKNMQEKLFKKFIDLI